jgi:hypothetical protein
MSVQVKYTGEHEEVELPDARAIVKRGEVIEVASDLAKALCEQEANWSKVEHKTTNKKGTE